MKLFITITGFLVFLVSCSPAVAPKVGYQSIAKQNKIIYLRRDGQRATLNRYLKIVKELNKYDESGLFSGIVVFNNNRYKVKDGSPNLVCDVKFVFLDEETLAFFLLYCPM